MAKDKKLPKSFFEAGEAIQRDIERATFSKKAREGLKKQAEKARKDWDDARALRKSIDKEKRQAEKEAAQRHREQEQGFSSQKSPEQASESPCRVILSTNRQNTKKPPFGGFFHVNA